MSRSHFSLPERLRYRFDNTMSRGVLGLIAWLGVACLALIVGAASVIALVGIRGNDGERLGFVEGFWQSLVRTLDPGTMGADVGWAWRLAALVVTIGGVLVVAALIGVVTTGLDARLRELSRGRGRVAEAGHTLVLGWSPKVVTVLTELAIANENQDRSAVVVLAPTDKSAMDAAIRERVAPVGRMRIITRSGHPHEHADLKLVNPQLAKSVIVLRQEDDTNDANVVKTVLALLYDVRVAPGTSLVAEMTDAAAAAALRAATDGRVAVIEPGSVVARATAQTCLVPGLNLVLEELLEFAGCEIYFAAVPELTGLTFGDALHAFAESIPIGLRRSDGTVVVNPPMGTRVASGDEVVVLAEDDDRIRFSSTTPVAAPRATSSREERQPDRPRRVVMFGFSDFSPPFVQELDQYLAPGSVLHAVIDTGLVPDAAVLLPTRLANLQVEVREVRSTADPVRSVLAEPCDHVVIFCYRRGLGPAEADARALMTFLGARRVLEEAGAVTNVVVEVLDVRDIDLVPAASADEFVVSERLSSLWMAQLSENAHLAPVLDDMLDAEGSELYIKPIERYCDPGQAVSFAQLVEAARRRGEIALGYRLLRDRGLAERRFGVTLNPPRETVPPLEAGDLLIVLAEDAR